MDRKLVPLGWSSREVRRDQRSVNLTIRPKELTGETAKGQPWPMGQKTPTAQLADERGRRIWSVRGPLSSWNSCRRSSLCHRTCSNRSYSCCRTREVGRWHRGDRVADTRSTWGGAATRAVSETTSVSLVSRSSLRVSIERALENVCIEASTLKKRREQW
jgi:hypothetical protein